MSLLLALTVRQPFASAILVGLKTEEYRPRRFGFRGRLVIHAGLEIEAASFASYPSLDPASCPTGAALGTVLVADCLEDVYEGFVLLLADPRPFPRPIPLKGKLGLWKASIPDELL